jgi:hypothetical protein
MGVYWSDLGPNCGTVDAASTSGSIVRQAVDGGGDMLLAAGQDCPMGLAVDTDNVYWTTFQPDDGGAVMKAPIHGGPSVALATGLYGPRSIAVDPTNVYWLDFSRVMKVPIAGGPAVVLADNQAPNEIAIDSTNVYWTEFGPNPAIKQIGKDGGSVVIVAAAQVSPTGIATDGTRIYWANSANPGGTVMVGWPNAAYLPYPITGQLDTPSYLAVDGTGVYWLVGEICPYGVQGTPDKLGLKPSVTLASDGGCIEHIAVLEGGAIYWTDPPRVMKLAKPAGW